MKTEEQIKEIIRLYTEEKWSMPKIASHYNYSVGAIQYTLRTRNIKSRTAAESNKRLSFFENFFKEINTQEKAYTLGLLYADGSNNQKGMTITLQEQDKGILDRLKAELNFTGDLYYKKRIREGCSNSYELNITSKVISEDLSKLGCVPKKSLILKFPSEEQVPKHLLSHFIRGYMDGDGSIFMCKQLYVSFVGTLEFLTKVQNIFQQEIGVSPTSLQIKCKKRATNNYQFAVGGNIKAQAVLEWIYKDSNIHLERKFNRFQEFKNNYNASLFQKNAKKINRINRICSTSGCNNKILAKGICNKCYQKEYYINNKQK